MTAWTNLRRSARGAALVEYGILVGLVAVVALASVAGLGLKVRGTFNTITAELSAAVSPSGPGTVGEDAGAVLIAASELVSVGATELPGIAGVYGFCRHGNCYAQHGTYTIDQATNWNIVGMWLDTRPAERDTVTMMITGFHKTALDADHAYQAQCDGGPVMPFDSLDYFTNEQGAGGSAVTYVRFTSQGVPFMDGEDSVCRIGPAS